MNSDFFIEYGDRILLKSWGRKITLRFVKITTTVIYDDGYNSFAHIYLFHNLFAQKCKTRLRTYILATCDENP
jgi:hypothetical protein